MAVPLNVTQGHRFLQWNINGVRAQHGSLFTILKTYNPSVVGLQETCLQPSSPTNLTFGSYSVHRHDRNSGSKGGVALLIRNSLPQIRVSLPNLQRLEAVAVQANIDNRWITFLSVYDPRGNAPLADFQALLGSVSTPVILMGDFNAHHPLWGDTLSDAQGKRLSDWFLDQDTLAILNDGSQTRLSRNNSQRDTAIDITFVSSALALFFQWSTLGDYGSDHCPILIESCLPHSSTSSVPQRWLYAKADWCLFRDTLDSAKLPSSRPESAESEVEVFTQLVHHAATVAIPTSSGSVADAPRAPPWWNAECAAKLRLAAVARRRAARTKNLEDRIHARKLTAISKRSVRDAKIKSWRAFCSSHTSSCTSGRAWTKVKWFRTGSQAPLAVPPLSVNGVSSSTPLVAATVLATHFGSGASHQTSTLPQPALLNPTPAPLFTRKQLTSTLRRLKNTAPGEDGISALILRNLSDTFLTWLLDIFNRCLLECVMPKAWKSGTVLAFLKPGKDPTKPDSYRPITLLSVLGKLFERLIKERLEWYLESNNLRYYKQTGFRKGRRSIDNVVYLNNAAKKALLNSGACLAVFLDIKDAFGSARHADILSALLKLRIDDSLYKFLISYLSDRTARVRVGTTLSDPYELLCGVPQGAVLSPLLFSLVIDDLADNLPPGLELLIYADDIVIFSSGTVLATIADAVQRGIDAITTLLKAKGFQLSATKCSSVCFTRKQRVPDRVSLKIDGSPLPISPFCRYLGVVFDQRLTWRPYIDSLHAQCTRLLGLLRAVVGSSWGADRTSMRMFYVALIRSRLDYAAVVYRDASTTNLQRLDRLQNAALRLILGTPRSTSIAAMEIEAYVPPLPLQRDLNLLKYFAHCRTSPLSHFLGTLADAGAAYSEFKGAALSLCRDWELTEVFDGLFHCAPAPTWPPWHPGPFLLDVDWLAATKDDLATCVTSSLFQHHLSTRIVDNMPVVYTDGSIQPNAQFSGFAFHVPQLGITYQYRTDPRVSICRVELSALVLAVMWLLGRGIYRAVLCSDSISALRLLSSVDAVDPLRCAMFRNLAQHPNVMYHLLWVPAHVGVPGNEAADLAAKSAVYNSSAKYVAVPPDSFFITRSLSQALLGKWQERWTSAEGGRFLNSLQPTITRSVLFDLSLGRRKERLFALARVNRFPTRSTLFRFNLSLSPQCPTCQLVDDTLGHRFMHCPRFNRSRMDFHSSLDNLSYPRLSRSLVDLLRFQDIPLPFVRPVLLILSQFLSRL